MEAKHTATPQTVTLYWAVQANGNRSEPTTREKALSIAKEMEAPYIVHSMYSSRVDPSYACFVEPIDCTIAEFDRFVGLPRFYS